jgi:hypothetical protein
MQSFGGAGNYENNTTLKIDFFSKFSHSSSITQKLKINKNTCTLIQNKFWNGRHVLKCFFRRMLKSGVFFVTSVRSNFHHFPRYSTEILQFFATNNIHGKISQFWLAKNSAMFSKYSAKKWNTQCNFLNFLNFLFFYFPNNRTPFCLVSASTFKDIFP